MDIQTFKQLKFKLIYYFLGINPLTKVKELTHAHASRLVKMNRDFSMIFYDCRKYGKPLSKFYKMYR